MKRRGALALAALAALVPLGAPAQDREEILAYRATVEVHDGGRMVVTEEIAVRALGDEIERGIYRDFPTSFPGRFGLGRIRAPFDVLSVERDGRPEPWVTESIGGPGGRGGVRVRIGVADVFLDHGEHRYVIRYETWRWVRFGEEHDQLYWNVTGNGWGFPILEASARLVLPRGPDPDVPVLEAWTGPEGSEASDARWRWEPEAASATFETTRPLGPREGLTVRLTFPRGVVAPPSPEVEEAWFRMDWGGYLDAAVAVALVLALYGLMWLRVGRDPQGRPLMVRYEPPQGMSPAGLGYLKRRGYDPSLLSATLVSLAVKGRVRIRRPKKEWELERTDAPEGDMAPEERAVLSRLLGSERKLKLTASRATTLQMAVKELKTSLSRAQEQTYFVLNRRWFAAGLALSVAGFAVLVWRDRYGIGPEAWFFSLWLSIWSLGTGTLVWRAFRAWSHARRGGGFGSWVEAVFLTLFSVPFVAAELFVLWLMVTRVPQHLVLAALALALVNVLFYHLLERPTLRGRGILDALDGFEAFLTAADADRLDRLTPPERTPELFERYLPHAIALGVENRWADRFQGVLTPQAATASGGALAWYHAGGDSDVGSVASSLGSSLSSSLSAASSPPSSGGGGGGGGGSSGGGGGGGGGGGW